MTGKPPLTVNLSRLPPSAVVADVVYAPLVSAAARRGAGRAGCAPSTGSACCCTRRCAASSLWFGVRPEMMPDLRALVEADLLREQA